MMTSFRRMLAATAAGALLFSSTVASAATTSAAALSLANAPAQDGGTADASESGGDRNVYINIGILAALVAGVLVATGGDGDDSSPDSP